MGVWKGGGRVRGGGECSVKEMGNQGRWDRVGLEKGE